MSPPDRPPGVTPAVPAGPQAPPPPTKPAAPPLAPSVDPALAGRPAAPPPAGHDFRHRPPRMRRDLPPWLAPDGPHWSHPRPPWKRKSGPPPWWPEGEPWPPPAKPDPKRTFLRRAGCFFGVVVGLMMLASAIGALVEGGPGGSVLLVLLLIGAVVFMGRALRRTAAAIGDVMAAADRVAAGDYSVRVPVPPKGEIAGLARAFNAMATRLEADANQRRALFADVAHELRTPLSVVRGSVEGMLDGVYPRSDERLETLLDETAVMTRLLEDLRTLSLAESGALPLHQEATHVAGLVDDLLTAFAPRAEAAGVRLTAAVAAMVPVRLDPVRVRQTLENLLANALRHTPRGGEIRLSVRREGERVCFAVADTGTGIPPEHLPHVFDRFWKSADSGGSGLGLAIARSLVEAHGGEISADSRLGVGTTVRFWLPAT